jgi:hypothetical protein
MTTGADNRFDFLFVRNVAGIESDMARRANQLLVWSVPEFRTIDKY